MAENTDDEAESARKDEERKKQQQRLDNEPARPGAPHQASQTTLAQGEPTPMLRSDPAQPAPKLTVEPEKALAVALAKFTEQQLANYQKHVVVNDVTDDNHRAQLFIARTVAAELTKMNEHDRIKEYFRREPWGLNKKDPRDEVAPAQERQQAQQEKANAAAPPTPTLAVDTEPQASSNELMQPAATLHEDRLQHTLARYADLRRFENLTPSESELGERKELVAVHKAQQDELLVAQAADQTSPHIKKQHALERKLLGHQQLAEDIGVQAKWIAHQLLERNPVDAKVYSTESREAFQMARDSHQQRQQVRKEIDHAKDATPAHLVEAQQKQSAEQEAAKGGRTLTTEQRANSSPEVKESIDRKDRDETPKQVPERPENHRSRRRIDFSNFGNDRGGRGR